MTLTEIGIENEKLVIEDIKNTPGIELEDHKKTHGIDLVVKSKEKTAKIEVKSARSIVIRKYNGKKYRRRGQFCICPHQVNEADYFAFVIIRKNGNHDIFYTDKEHVARLIANRKRTAKRHNITIPQMRKELKPKSNLNYFFS
jgi:hypothetical protein